MELNLVLQLLLQKIWFLQRREKSQPSNTIETKNFLFSFQQELVSSAFETHLSLKNNPSTLLEKAAAATKNAPRCIFSILQISFARHLFLLFFFCCEDMNTFDELSGNRHE